MHITLHDGGGKWSWLNHKGRNSKGRIPSSRWSNKCYIFWPTVGLKRDPSIAVDSWKRTLISAFLVPHHRKNRSKFEYPGRSESFVHHFLKSILSNNKKSKIINTGDLACLLIILFFWDFTFSTTTGIHFILPHFPLV